MQSVQDETMTYLIIEETQETAEINFKIKLEANHSYNIQVRLYDNGGSVAHVIGIHYDCH